MTSTNFDMNQVLPNEKGIVLTHIEELALSAFNLFKSNQYEKSLETLNKIMKLKEQEGGSVNSRQPNQSATASFDPKVQHNITLLQYLLSQKTEPRKFLDGNKKILHTLKNEQIQQK